MISIQNEREWSDFCHKVLLEPELVLDPRCCNNAARMENRAFVEGKVAQVFEGLSSAALIDRLTAAQTAYGNVNSVHDLINHPQLRTRRMQVGSRQLDIPANPWITEWDRPVFQSVPGIDEHGASIRSEFSGD